MLRFLSVRSALFLAGSVLVLTSCLHKPSKITRRWSDLFYGEGVPLGWTVRQWDDVSKAGPSNSVWVVKKKILMAQGPRDNWLMSDREYGDFELEFDFRLGPTGNSGLALRAPMRGDPAFDGLELQMADY